MLDSKEHDVSLYYTHTGTVSDHKCSVRDDRYIGEINCDNTDTFLKNCNFEMSNNCEGIEDDSCRSSNLNGRISEDALTTGHATVSCLRGNWQACSAHFYVVM